VRVRGLAAEVGGLTRVCECKALLLAQREVRPGRAPFAAWNHQPPHGIAQAASRFLLFHGPPTFCSMDGLHSRGGACTETGVKRGPPTLPPSCPTTLAGQPPSWARHPRAPMLSLHARCVALWGEGYDASGVRTVRKKLIKHHDNVRPAYYGSWSRTWCVAAALAALWCCRLMGRACQRRWSL